MAHDINIGGPMMTQNYVPAGTLLYSYLGGTGYDE